MESIINSQQLKMLKFLKTILIFFFTLNLLHSQNCTLNGYVLEQGSKEPLINVTLTVKGTKIGTLTNKSGYYSLKNIPSGKQTIVISYIGYQKLESEMFFKEDESIKKDFELKNKTISGKEIVVTAEREIEKRQINVSKVDIPIGQLSQIRIGGEADIFRALQYLPGVLTSSQISSGLYIRGGSPDQNLVLIDGSTVYNPSHLLGFYSSFNPEAIKDVELIKGGFPAEYGGRMSAVLNLTQKDGNRDSVEGTATLGIISSKASLQGPIGNGSWFLGGRRTYLDLLLSLLPEDSLNPLPSFNFWDANGKITQDLSDNDKVFTSGYLSADNLNFGGGGLKFNLGISNKAGAVRWNHIFGDNLFSVLNLSVSKYKTGFDVDNAGFAFQIENSITDYTSKLNLEWFTSNDLTIKTGLDYTHYVFKYLQNFTGKLDSLPKDGQVNGAGGTNFTLPDDVFSGYLQANYQVNDLLGFQVGAHGYHYTLPNTNYIDPRIAARYQLNEDVILKAAVGRYTQYLKLASLPDFSFFDTWLPTDTTVLPGFSNHYNLSIETQPFEGFNFNVDMYYKTLENISEINQYTTTSKSVSDAFYTGNGNSYGLELFLQKKAGDLTGWVGYSLGFVNAKFDSINNGKEFRPKYDRRHDLKIVGQYKINDRWDLGGSFTYQTGQSYTGVTSRYEARLPGQNSGIGITVPAERYGLRLPSSHQLNLNATYNTSIFGLPLKMLIDVYNVYSRRDIWFSYYDVSKKIVEVTDVLLLPIIPTISVEVKF